jgi:hypothetical protein
MFDLDWQSFAFAVSNRSQAQIGKRPRRLRSLTNIIDLSHVILPAPATIDPVHPNQLLKNVTDTRLLVRSLTALDEAASSSASFFTQAISTLELAEHASTITHSVPAFKDSTDTQRSLAMARGAMITAEAKVTNMLTSLSSISSTSSHRGASDSKTALFTTADERQAARRHYHGTLQGHLNDRSQYYDKCNQLLEQSQSLRIKVAAHVALGGSPEVVPSTAFATLPKPNTSPSPPLTILSSSAASASAFGGSSAFGSNGTNGLLFGSLAPSSFSAGTSSFGRRDPSTGSMLSSSRSISASLPMFGGPSTVQVTLPLSVSSITSPGSMLPSPAVPMVSSVGAIPLPVAAGGYPVAPASCAASAAISAIDIGKRSVPSSVSSLSTSDLKVMAEEIIVIHIGDN